MEPSPKRQYAQTQSNLHQIDENNIPHPISPLWIKTGYQHEEKEQKTQKLMETELLSTD